MTDLDASLSAMLERRATDARVDDRLTMITDRVEIVRIDRPPDRSTRRTRRTAAAMVAVAVIGLGVLMARAGDDRSPTPPAEPIDAEIYPVFSDLGDLDAAVYGSYAVPDPANPARSWLVLGRRSSDTWTDVVTIRASDPPAALNPTIGYETSTTRLGSVPVTAHVINSPTAPEQTFYTWEVNGVGVTMNDGPDAAALAEATVASRSVDGPWPSIDVDAFPDGLTVLAGPFQSSPAPQPGLSTDTGSGFGLDVFVGPGLGVPATADRLAVHDLGDVEAYSAPLDDGAIVSWPVAPDAWATLSSRGVSQERLVEIARDITFVDETTWSTIYDPGPVDSYTAIPTTIPAEPSSE